MLAHQMQQEWLKFQKVKQSNSFFFFLYLTFHFQFLQRNHQLFVALQEQDPRILFQRVRTLTLK